MLNNDYDEALADLDKAIKLEPNNEAMKSEYNELLKKREEVKASALVLLLQHIQKKTSEPIKKNMYKDEEKWIESVPEIVSLNE